MVDKAGDLYVVATPIGNLGDMVPRALDILQAVDAVLAEDTRHSGRLLAHFGVTTPMQAYHDYSDERQLQKILEQLLAGRDLALITDAGTPLIADPGYRLVREARRMGSRVIPVPGPCALVAALSCAGVASDRFAFEGFLPARSGQRQQYLQGLAGETRTLIFYEAPHRIVATLDDMQAVFGPDRELVLARELTKAHETFLSGSLAEIAAMVAADPNQQRGEIVLVLAGAQALQTDRDEAEQSRILQILMAEMPLKQAAAVTARITGAGKNRLYQLALSLRE